MFFDLSFTSSHFPIIYHLTIAKQNRNEKFEMVTNSANDKCKLVNF